MQKLLLLENYLWKDGTKEKKNQISMRSTWSVARGPSLNWKFVRICGNKWITFSFFCFFFLRWWWSQPNMRNAIAISMWQIRLKRFYSGFSYCLRELNNWIRNVKRSKKKKTKKIVIETIQRTLSSLSSVQLKSASLRSIQIHAKCEKKKSDKERE